MQATTTEDTVLLQKTRDLCQSILEQPDFRQIRERLDAFMSDEAAKNQYQLVMEKGYALQQKQQFGMPLDNNEIVDFEKNRELLLANPIGRNFIEAQQQMQKIQESVMQYVSKTFELGRIPTPDDFSSEGCGSGCGCH